MKRIILIGLGLIIGMLETCPTRAYDMTASYLNATNAIIQTGIITTGGQVTRYGYNTTGTYWAIAIGAGANGDNVGTAMGVYNTATNWGTAVGYRTDASSFGVAIGTLANAPGVGNVAIGGTLYLANPPTNPTNNAAMVPSNFVDTVELGRGTATLQGGLNFRGYGIANSNGVVVASINTTNLTVSGTTYVPRLGDLQMGSFTNQPTQ